VALRRFHFRSEDRVGEMVWLRGSEAHHLLAVIRAKVGRRVILFNEKGDEFLASVVRVEKGEAELSIQEKVAAERTFAGRIDMAVALVKGRAMERILSGVTELGMRGIAIVPSARSVPRIACAAVAGRLARWEKIVLSAAKQSGRPAPPVVEYLPCWSELPGRAERYDRTFIAREGVTPNSPRIEPSDAVLVIVGPEGGFTNEEESALLERGARPLGLGPFTLRCETAAVVAASLLVNTMLAGAAPTDARGGAEG